VKAKGTIANELRRVKKLLKMADAGRDEDTMYGAMQALSWALDRDAAAPSKLAPPIQEKP
jgi:hypothetical protein